MFNWFRGVVANIDGEKLTSGTQTILINLLEQIEENHLEIGRLITLGKASDARIEELNQEILNAVKMVHPIADIAHALIPESMSHLHKWMDFAQDVYHQVIEPALNKKLPH